MALVVGENSWATVAEADDFLSDWVGSGSWFSLSETPTEAGGESKETYLTTAYWWLLSLYEVAPSETAPAAVKRAQSYAALWLIGFKEDYEQRDALIASGVEEFSWSQWNEKLTGVTVPKYINDIFVRLGLAGMNTAVQLYGEDYQR